ncbi:NAD(P)-dependent alcohol dehydrogenase [Parapedobacter sp. 10938]|uniref:NAD(P)-dependent alcohol dehydrogenase n=1 Tax=Parapedobacter flavus TaxID=3110225 RepID=UPI002DBFF6E2|nr:NAD(P)-dependent alcohol dehydrogenase [Parapedobacter sp. 10938]MEC3881185.1 NAD(P)-dependent alcohol dehydrogenase [Parapedobacter sp. 10938]
MKAAVYTKYGPPEVVSVMEIEKPQPAVKEVLIKIHATTVNRTDCGFRSAEYFVSRFWSGLLKPNTKILGNEFAGEIVGIGGEVTLFNIGDRVFGYDDGRFGSHAEYKVIAESGTLFTVPDPLTYHEVVPATEGAHYALSNIRAAKVTAGQQVLVNGATGAIGSAAVQLLHYFGAHVTAVCATPHIELVRNLGADVVIDYLNDDFTKTDHKFDFIFDAVGKSSFDRCKPLLKKKGIYVSTELGKNGENIPLALLTPIFGGRKCIFPIPKFSTDDMRFLKERIANGDFRPVIDRHYPLDQIVDAYRYVETGQKIGNVVITINS